MFWIILSIFICMLTIYRFKENILYYLSFKSHKTELNDVVYARRNELVLSENISKTFGIDVSHYQGEINWNKVKFINNEDYPIKFAFIRATQGCDKRDIQFANNWNNCKKRKIIRGAYHYYRPNENSLEQAENFIKNVRLSKGDLPPVLDIEKLPKNQSVDNLKLGLRRFLNKIEQHYKVQPIIYSGERYYQDFLKDEFSEYQFWIANYNFIDADINDDYLIWQFTEHAKIKGISENVDVNIFNGNVDDLNQLRID